ncbi:DUF4913 domain-containing protein [Actinomyces faecalis]
MTRRRYASRHSRSWEHPRQDPATGMSVWLRDHADHHMA